MKAFFHDIRRICAFLIGAVLFLSGMFKLIDPVGTGLIVTEFAKFFWDLEKVLPRCWAFCWRPSRP